LSSSYLLSKLSLIVGYFCDRQATRDKRYKKAIQATFKSMKSQYHKREYQICQQILSRYKKLNILMDDWAYWLMIEHIDGRLSILMDDWAYWWTIEHIDGRLSILIDDWAYWLMIEHIDGRLSILIDDFWIVSSLIMLICTS